MNRLTREELIEIVAGISDIMDALETLSEDDESISKEANEALKLLDKAADILDELNAQ